MMEEEELQKKDESFLFFSKNSPSSALSRTVGTVKESARNYNKSDFTGDQTVPPSVEDDLVNNQRALVSLEKTQASEKSRGAFEVLCTPSTAAPVSVKTTHVSATVSSGIISVISTTTSCGKVGQGSQKISQTDMSLISQKPGTVEQNLVDSCSGGGDSSSEAAADNKMRQVNINHTDVIDTSKERYAFSCGSKTTWNSSHIMDAHEISKNNNNIDKPLNANESGVSHSSVNPKECQTSSVNQHMWNHQVPHSQGETFRVCPSGNLGASARPSPAADAGASKSGSWLRNNSRSGSEDVPAGLHSYNQPLPTISPVSRTWSEPKGSVVLHGTSGSTFFTTTVQSSARKESTFQSLSVTESLKSASVPVSVSAISTYPASFSQSHRAGVDVKSAAADLSRQEVASSLNQSPTGSIHHKTAFSTRSETPNELELNHTKSKKSHSVYKTAEEASEHVKNISAKGGESRASTTSLMNSAGFSESKLLSTSSSNHPLSIGQKPLFAANLVELAQSLQPSPGHLSAVSDHAVAPHRQSCHDQDNQAATPLISGERRVAAPKLTKKAHSRSPKPKFYKAAQLTADEEDDNNDFIPVGMLQLSPLKRPEDNGTTAANIEFHSAENNVGTVYQLNQGLNVIYKQQTQPSHDQTQCAEKPGVEELTACVQEKLKQKVQQHKLKQQASSGGQEQSLPLQGTTAQKQQEQGYDPQRHQLFMKLVQHAQQQQRQLQDLQQRQLQDQQHHLHQPQSILSPATSGQSKSPGFLKNQGLIIHHHQAQDVKPAPGVQKLSQQTMARGQEMRSEQSGDQQCLQEHSTQQFAEVNFKNPEKSGGIEKSYKQQQQRDQRYSQQHPAPACPTEPSGQLQQQTAAVQQESLWQVQSSNIPKIAERLLQQSLNEQMMQQVRPDQMLSHSKSEQIAQSLSHNVSVSRSDPRPITPASVHHAMPSVNQQHPEIARMLSSPVSPRQPASPRQAVSPRRTASPIQLSATASQFSHQHLVSPHPRPSVGLHQPANSKPFSSTNSTSSYQSTSLKQAVSSQQVSDPRQLQNSAHSSTLMEQLASTGHAPQSNEQFVPMPFPVGQRTFEQTRIDPIQPPEKPQYSQNEQQPSEGRAQQMTADRQHVGADISITLPNSDAHKLNTLQSIPFSQTVQSFSPGQIIHYRPPENKNVQSKVLTVHKSQPSLLVQFPSPTVSSTKSPMPLTQTASSAWHPALGQADSEMTVQLHTPFNHLFEPVNIQRSDNKFQVLQVNQPHDRKQLADNAVESQLQHLSQTQVRDKLPVSLSVHSVSQSYQQDRYEVQPKPSSMPFVQPASTHTDIQSVSSYMSSAHNRHFQTIANLTEKEASFLQSLFASSPSDEIDERIQRHPNQEPHPVPQMQASHGCPLEEPKRSEDSLKLHTASATLYPEMRKNEGGLKVLSEIASKRYALDVAGKEDEADQQASCSSAEDTDQDAPRGSHGIPQVTVQSEQTPADETPAANSMIDSGSDTEQAMAAQQTTSDAQEKTHKSFEAKSDNSDTEAKSVDREAKDSSVTHGETPRREVRQRKPKKPFEQEEAPVKRPSKVSPPKNIPGKKQAQIASAQNPTHKKGHSQREKTAEIKLKEEIEKEDKAFIRQTRSAVENRLAEREKRDHVMEDSEDVKPGEFDSPSRRLSRRLQEKEKELLQQKKAEENESSVSTRQQPARINNTDDASGESISPMTTKSSRRVSISSADDNLLPETTERMRTRSKNRSADDKVVSGGGKTMDSQDQSSQSSTEQKKPTNNSRTSTPNVATVSSNKENRRETRHTSKSPGHDSQSPSPARLAKTAPVTLTRMATRQKVVDVEHSRSSVGVTTKRLLPPTPAEELLHWQKRVKKLDIPTVVLESFKLPDGKPGIGKEETQKDIAKDKEMTVKEVTKPETEIVKVKHSKKKKQKSKKKRNRQKPAQPTAKEDQKRSEHDDSEDGDMVVAGNEDDSQEKDLVSDSEQGEHELSSDGHEVAGVPGEQSPKQTAEENTEKTVSSPKNDDHDEAAMDTVHQEATEDETNIDARKDNMDNSQTEEGTDRASKEVLQTVEATPEPNTAEQQSVIKCTSAFVHPSAKSKESPHSSVPSSASAKACPGPNDKSISHTTLAGERRKMLMYKLVPVLEEDAHSEESLVPFSGFLISNGNSDHVLIPHDIMHKPVLTTSSSSSAAAGFGTSSSFSSSSVDMLSTLATLEASDVARSAVLPSSRAHGNNPLAPEVVCTSGSTFEWLPTVYSPMKLGQRTAIETTPVPAAWTSPGTGSSLPTVSNLSAWSPQWSSCSSQTTPAAPAGEPSPVMAVAKSRMSAAVAQPAQSQYRPSEPWDATPASMPSSSSSLSPFPIASSAWDSSASVPLPAPPQQQCAPEQSWPAASQQPAQESPWSSSPSVTESALESWSKEYFPSVAYTSARAHTQLQQQSGSAPQAVLPSPGYSLETGSSQQTQMYTTNQTHTASSGAPYSAGAPPQDTEFVDGRHDSLIQSYLRQVASNPGGFSQELAGFSLGQQDLAYLESRLRQSLSPNTLFNAVAAYDDATGQGTIVGHDGSLQESINLVHTVNLDMEEGHLESSNNLDLSDLRNNLTSSLAMSRNLEGHRTSQSNREETLNDDGNGGSARHRNSLTQQDGVVLQDGAVQQDGPAAASGVLKNDGKKPIRERKSQYEIVIQGDMKRYRCLSCDKNFGVATIYRHLRTHDPDYKVSCSLCGKQYTQRQSLIVHWLKTHGDHAPPPDLMKSPKYEELPSSEPLQLSHGQPAGSQFKSADGTLLKPSGALIRPPGTHIKSPGDPKRQRRSSSTCDHVAAVYDKAGISMQEAAHQQVEELRRLKAEKKLAAAQRKTDDHISDDGGVSAGDSLLRGISQPAGLADDDKIGQADNTKNLSDFANRHIEHSAVVYERNVSQKTSFPGSTVTADSGPATSRMSSNAEEDYADLEVTKPQNLSDTQFHFSSPLAFMPTVPQFHADNIPKPISTPVVKSNRSTEPSCSKEVMSVEDKSNRKPVKVDGKYACELCNTLLNTRGSYISHMRRHSNIKTKFCSYCSKGFHTMQELRCHERTHTGERPYKCEICHTMFAHSGSYVSHKKSHQKRGELEPFPIIDGRIEYPSTFKKPRLSGGVEGGGEKTRRVKKKKEAVPALGTMESEQPNQRDQGNQQISSVIQRNNLDNLHEPVDCTPVEFNTDIPGRWQNLGQQRAASEHFRPNVASPGVGDHNINSDTLRVVATPQSMLRPEQGSQGFVPPGEDYTSASGSMSTDYYSGTVGYSQDMVQREFLSPPADTSSPHGFYKQDKYTPRASSVDTYPTASQNQVTSLPAIVAVEKSLQYASSYSNSGQGGKAYYSPQQHSSEYPYGVPRPNEDYQQDDFDESLIQYKNDPSSSEIVKKLLQHYNVPASSFQDAVPIDYSHQIPDESEYSHGTGSEYSGMGIGRSTPAPPSYSASISSQQKLYYSQSSSSGYGPGLLRTQPLITPDQAALNLHESRHHQLLQSLVVNDGQFGSPYPQGQHQDVYSSDDRYSSSHSNQSTRFASPSLP